MSPATCPFWLANSKFHSLLSSTLIFGMFRMTFPADVYARIQSQATN